MPENGNKTECPDDEGLTFTCPKCKGNILERVEKSQECYRFVEKISPDGQHEFSNKQELIPATIEKYQCSDCGYTIRKNGLFITDPLELVKWITGKYHP